MFTFETFAPLLLARRPKLTIRSCSQSRILPLCFGVWIDSLKIAHARCFQRYNYPGRNEGRFAVSTWYPICDKYSCSREYTPQFSECSIGTLNSCKMLSHTASYRLTVRSALHGQCFFCLNNHKWLGCFCGKPLYFDAKSTYSSAELFFCAANS